MDEPDEIKENSRFSPPLKKTLKKTLEKLSKKTQKKTKVIPNEYGVEPKSKLAVGGKIASALLGKLLCDLANVRDESARTAGLDDGSEPASPFETYADPSGAPGSSTADRAPRRAARTDLVTVKGGGGGPAAAAAVASAASASSPASAPSSSSASKPAAGGGAGAGEGEAAEGEQHRQLGEEALDNEDEGEEEEEEEDDESTMHRLCPTYAQDINSPLRHVRTRIYFTSESHVHSLVNVLRFAHLKYGFEQEEKEKKERAQQAAAAAAAAAAGGGGGEDKAAAASAAPASETPPPPSPTPPPQMPFSSHPPLLSPEAIGEFFFIFFFFFFFSAGDVEKTKQNKQLTLFSLFFSFHSHTKIIQPAYEKTPRSSTT